MHNEEQVVEEFTSLGEAVFEQLGAVSPAEDAAVLDAMVEAGMSVPVASASAVPTVVGIIATAAVLVGIAAFVGRPPEVLGVALSAATIEQNALGDASFAERPTNAQFEARPDTRERPQPQVPPGPLAQPEHGEAGDGAAVEDTAVVPEQGANAAAKSSGMSAAELLVAANAASRTGKRAKARTLYAELAREHSDSHERQVAHVGLGDLELKAGRAKRALREYAAYLRANPKGNLVEDALAGKARSLDALDRTGEAKEAWAALLDRFPTSVHASKARRQLE